MKRSSTTTSGLCWGGVLLVFNPLPMETLSALLRKPGTYTPFKKSDIYTALRPLHSLLLIPDSEDDPVQVLHKSLPDFLTEPGRCKDERFFINPPIHHQEILLSCLNLMKERLRRNICNLDDYAILSEVGDISARRKEHIGGTLKYACCFWTKHLVEIPSGSHDVEEVLEAIDNFFTTCLLSWIEVLVVMESPDVGVYAINDVRQWYISVSSEWFV